MRYLLCLSLWGLLPFLVQAQNQCNLTLSGKVIDEHDSSALSFASISVLNHEHNTVANDKGEYLLKNLCPGNYTLRCIYIGCDTIDLTIQINKSSELNFYLEKHIQLLNNIDHERDF